MMAFLPKEDFQPKCQNLKFLSAEIERVSSKIFVRNALLVDHYFFTSWHPPEPLFKELDTKRSYYDNTTWCFCNFDHWCNASSAPVVSLVAVVVSVIVGLMVTS